MFGFAVNSVGQVIFHRRSSNEAFFLPLAQFYYINRSNVFRIVHFSTQQLKNVLFSLSLLLSFIFYKFNSFPSIFFTFFSSRFDASQVIRADRSDRWTLQIKFPQLRDSGIYECQVNTEPKMSLAFRLNVVGEYFVTDNKFSFHFILHRCVCRAFAFNFNGCVCVREKVG